ncbi:MAG: hypothetical protein JSR71_04245 [Proteobacteria bacterium]|nr:hypothetical protein [Pseudomonadota bacterium]
MDALKNMMSAQASYGFTPSNRFFPASRNSFDQPVKILIQPQNYVQFDLSVHQTSIEKA